MTEFYFYIIIKLACGEVVEWFKALVLKTSEVRASVGSNPTLSAIYLLIKLKSPDTSF